MRHFPLEQWADWVRETLPRASSSGIQEHLEQDCDQCRADLTLWQSVARTAQRDVSYEPPREVVESAVQLYAQHRPLPEPPVPGRMAQLLFDSLRTPLPAGIRSLAPATRHVTYRAGSFFIDVRIEEHGSSENASLVGQVMHDPDRPELSLEGLSVILTSSHSREATRTNRFGEFVFEMNPELENSLAIGVSDDFALVVPLDEPSEEN